MADRKVLEIRPTKVSQILKLKEPISHRTLSTREQIILLESSKVHGFVFPPWKSAPTSSEFESKLGMAPFLDNSELRLSELQSEVFDGWRRPSDVVPPPSHGRSSDGTLIHGPTTISGKGVDLVQDVTSDCSVVASLCAGMARVERGHTKIISSIMYPYDHNIMKPMFSPNGKYIFRLHFNGCFRTVVIDDRLPASRTTRALHVVDRRNPGLLWPALVEKAYLKVRGGYDFPGSNSGTDLWVLTGWIPEQLFLQSDEIVPNLFWRRIYNAFNYGDVLITLGTGKLSRFEEEGLGLAGEHDYAVIDMREDEGNRQFLVKNPWLGGNIWRGRSNAEFHGPTPPIILDAGGAKKESIKLMPGTFWMDLNNVFQHFDTIYLNWNPGLFVYRQDLHFTWDMSTTKSPAGSFDRNPQYQVHSVGGGTVWILLSKHFKSVYQKEIKKHTEVSSGFISLYAFDKGGERVLLSDAALTRSPYVDAPNSLLRLELPENLAYTIVISEQEVPSSRYNFTLSAFSSNPVTIAEAAERYVRSTFLQGAWTFSTSGGNASSAKYCTNPQYSINLSATSDVAILLASDIADIPVHVKLLWANGQRITAIAKRDIVKDSGDYRKGSALTEIHEVQAGTYTIVCSTFEQGQLGKFSLHVRTTTQSIIKPIPLEEAGRFVLTLPRAIFSQENNRLLAPLQVSRITRIRLIATAFSKQASGSPLRIALESGQGPNKNILALSGNGEYTSGTASLRTNDVNILPEMCKGRGVWLVLERAGSSVVLDEGINLEILSDHPATCGAWGTGNG